MPVTRRELFTTVRTEGGLLPADLLQRILASDRDLPGLTPADYHLLPGEKPNEAINRAWQRLLGAWTSFREAAGKLPATEALTGLTRERWLLPLFQELGYGRLPAPHLTLDGAAVPISHAYAATPIHLVGRGVGLDERSRGVAGAARTSPHSLVQDFLNRSDDHLWGIVSNGLRLRLLRDSKRLTRQTFVEFDLEAMLDGEDYADFVLLWLLLHQSRVELAEGRAERCWLERWAQDAEQRGTRALDGLRKGVTQAIAALGGGFLCHPANRALRERLKGGDLAKQDYYRQLLRLVYRLLFLFAAEDRDLLLDPAADADARQRYADYYSTARLRRLAGRQRGTRHADLYHGLRVVMAALGGEAAGHVADAARHALGLPALGSFLWSGAATPDLNGAEIANADLLAAVRALAYTEERGGRRPVDYKNLGAEELGSVYESLLELHPDVNADTGHFALDEAGGNDRKTTGSYYTPSALVQQLLDTALDPVLDEAARQPEAEQAILALRVCDPACGSGHFLIAAAHRLARRLAQVRTGDDEPAPAALRTALRDVIGHCLYGVDVNEMAVELCKVALWMEALEPGRPLSFLDHRIQCGNSLLGTTPALLARGLPDAALEPITGDDKKIAATYKRRNREERERERKHGARQGVLDEQQPWERAGNLAAALVALEAIDDGTVDGVRRKEERYAELVRSSAYEAGRLLTDAWCAAFVWEKTPAAVAARREPITQETLRRLERNPNTVDPVARAEVRRLAGQYRFFHWHLAFPDVFRPLPAGDIDDEDVAGWEGGFDVVLGNPPWEHTELKEKEWFATREPEIANARNDAERKRRIEQLKADDPVLYAAFESDRRQADGVSHFVRNSKRFPLCGSGRINTYSIFAETIRLLLRDTGRLGCVIPSGIATDDTTKFFFRDLMASRTLVSLYDFENAKAVFSGVHRSYKFCLLTLTGPARPAEQGAEFAFFIQQVDELRDPERRFTLSADDLALLNPNTGTCAIFRSRRDAELTRAIYRRVPVLIAEGPPGRNPWGISFKQGLFNMATDSGLFCTRAELERAGLRLEGSTFIGRHLYLPLYEAKMLHQFDHRWATYAGADTRDLTPAEKSDPAHVVLPRYWVPASEVEARLRDRWSRGWLLGWRDICRSTDERTVIASLLPRVGVGHTCPLLLTSAGDALLSSCLVGNLSAFAFDYVARQKIGGTHLTYGYLNQLPILPPHTYTRPCPWSLEETLRDWIARRVLELVYTAWDLESFAQDCGYDGPPFRWDEARRFLLRCELDASYFHLYGIARDDVTYILDTFPIVRRKAEAAHGEYRTQRVILERYDALAAAMASGEPYQTVLDPPPADPRVAHPPRGASSGTAAE